VEAIGDLARLWRSLKRGVSIKASAVAADNRDFRMPL
jgi:hypothetical protein